MGFAVELYFDPETEAAVREVRHVLSDIGIPNELDGLGDRPHISLAVFDEFDPDSVKVALRKLARATRRFAIALQSVESFPESHGVVYLAPRKSPQLQQLHEKFHEILAKNNAQSREYYLPGHWTPHCTIAQGFGAGHVEEIVARCRKQFERVDGTVCDVGVVKFRPVESVYSFALKAAGKSGS